MYFIGVLTILCLSALTTAESWNNLTHGKIVVCPIVTQSVLLLNENSLKYNETDWRLCTHLIVADDTFFDLKKVSEDKRIEDYKVVTDLRVEYPHLKISLNLKPESIFKKELEKHLGTKRIVGYFEKIADDIKKYSFDGIDIAGMIFGNFKGGVNFFGGLYNNADTFPRLLRELKYTLTKQNLIITLTFSPVLDFTSKEVKFSEYVDIFDFFHIYPLASNTDEVKDTFGNALNEIKPSNMKMKILNLVNNWGIPPSKLILGILIGGQVAKTTFNGNIMEAINPGFFPYELSCRFLANNETFEKMFDEENQLIHMIFKYEDEDEKEVIAIPTTRTVANYMNFAVENKLGGAMAITINDDDHQGLCKLDDDTFNDFKRNSDEAEIPKRIDNKFPFMYTINEALFRAVQATKKSASSSTTNSFCAILVLLTIFLSLT